MRMNEIRALMCDEGWFYLKTRWGVQTAPPNPLVCAECEALCLGGVKLLENITEEEFQALLCGADCNTCRQPCNLYRIAIKRKIKPVIVGNAIERRSAHG